jgi:predicted ATPase
MLFRFRTRNFRSIRDEVELSLVASNLTDLPEAVFPAAFADRGVLVAAAIYGANASGKTNVLRAMQFMRSAVEGSQRFWAPEGIQREVFLLDPTSVETPSLFEADFILGHVRYTYGFELDSRRVLREWLHAYPTPRRQAWFEREGDEYSFSKSLIGENNAIRNLTRPNSLFLSAAAQNNHEQILPLYRFLSSVSFVIGDRAALRDATAEMADSDEYHERIRTLISSADLGIEGLEIRESPWAQVARRRYLAAVYLADSDIESGKQISFLHRGTNAETVAVPLDEESEGTVAYFSLLGPVLQTLSSGGLLVIDEITSSLHPLLAMEIVRMFNSRERNPKGAQLIFNTHDTTLLDSRVLRRDQVWFTEKGEGGATHLYPLTDFKTRRGENVKSGYLQGRYGAVPYLELAHIGGDQHETPDAD